MSTTTKRRSMVQWIRDHIVDEKATFFTISHSIGGRPKEIKTIQLGNKQWEPKDLSATFEQIAEEECAGYPGMHAFVLMAFNPECPDKDRPLGSLTFRIQGGSNLEEDQGGYVGTEPPTQGGITTMLMRHIEAVQRIAQQQTQAAFNVLSKTCETLSSANSSLAEENLKAVELAKEAFTSMKREDLEIAQEQSKQETRKALVQRALTIGPGLINQLAGRQILPVSTADTEIIEGLAKSITDDQLGKLASILTPDQLALIIPRISQIVQDQSETKVLPQ
jgi:hypothetical protein